MRSLLVPQLSDYSKITLKQHNKHVETMSNQYSDWAKSTTSDTCCMDGWSDKFDLGPFFNYPPDNKFPIYF